jgi:hypothetical protein
VKYRDQGRLADIAEANAAIERYVSRGSEELEETYATSQQS